MTRIAFAFLLALIATEAQAQQWRHLPMLCGSHEWVSAYIDRYDEQLLHTGKIKDGRVAEFWVNQSTGTWTEVIRHKAFACIMADGEHFDPAPETAKGEPS